MHLKWVWTDKQRNIRRTPMYHTHKELDADLWAEAGWEQPQWFDSNADLVDRYEDQIPSRNGWEGKY